MYFQKYFQKYILSKETCSKEKKADFEEDIDSRLDQNRKKVDRMEQQEIKDHRYGYTSRRPRPLKRPVPSVH